MLHRLADRVGIVPRLLVCALLAMLLAVTAVQLWTLRSVSRNGLRQVEASLKVSMAMLRHELAPLGTAWSLTDGRLLLGTTALNGRNDLVDTVRQITGASATVFLGETRIATNVKNPDGSRGIGTKLAAGRVHDALLRDGRAYTGRANILGAPYLTDYEPIADANGRTIGILFVGVPLADAEAFMTRIVAEAEISALVIALLAGLAYLWALRATIRPLRDITGAMHRIAGGALNSDVPCLRRADQIGQMARALLQLREASARARALEEEATARAGSEVAKRGALVAMLDKIETEITKAIGEVGTRTASMMATAEKMAASATRTGFSATGAATASGQALANAQTVAGAAEHLSTAIRQIGARVDQSNEIVGRAVAAGGEARAALDALHEQVGRIGSVADIIGEIASRTNLLALNATIEAARAGDAGKGFAVVASEVKSLATQTARSTGEISQHIAQVRSATGVSVQAVARIEQTIHEIDAIAGSIAGAVQGQATATAEIARNISETASAANEVTSHATEVSAEAEESGQHAAEVCEDADNLNKAMNELRHAVIRLVRTSTTDMDRRGETRYPQDLACQLSIAGRSQAARLTDLSSRGACVEDGPALSVGQHGKLTIAGVEFALPFAVRAVEDKKSHLLFELDAATAERFRPIPERLANRRAA